MDDSRPKLRTDLIVTSESDGDGVVYTVKEPFTGRFFRLRAPEYYLLTRADGQTTATRAAELTGERFGVRIPADAARAFFARMERLLFFEGPALDRELPRLSRRATAGRRRSIWMIRLKAFDPDALLSRLIDRLRFLFRPEAVGIAFVLMLGASLVLVGDRGAWGAGLSTLWRLSSLPLLFAGIVVVGFVHEFGHALTLKYYGGTVREMGFLLLYFQPCFYCNLSDAYLLPQRRAKLLVGFAGLFFQGVLTALFILMWRLVTPGTILANFLYAATAFSMAVFLFNFNPLIRLDGYYLLADWLRVPNLRSRAFSYWRTILAEWTVGRPSGRKPSRRLRIIYDWYGILASVYTAVLVGWLLVYVTRLVQARWGLAGNAILYGALGWFVFRTSGGQSGATGSQPAARDAEAGSPRRNWKKPVILWGGLAALLAVLALWKVEHHVGSPCRVEPVERFTVTSPISGTLEMELFEGRDRRRSDRTLLQAVSAEFSTVNYSIRVKEGDAVSVGDTVLVLSSNLFEAKLAQKESERERVVAERNLLLSGPKRDRVMALRAEIEQITAQLDNTKTEMSRADQLIKSGLIAQVDYEAIQTDLKVLTAQRAAKKSELALMISAPKAEELAIKEAQIRGLDVAIDFLRSQIQSSAIITPIDGIVNRVNRGTVLVEIARLDPVCVELNIDECDIADVSGQDAVTLKVRTYPFATFEGRVSQIAVDADTVTGQPRFTVTTKIDNHKGALKPGMTGYAKIACGKQSLLALATRRLVQYIRVEFWSLW